MSSENLLSHSPFNQLLATFREDSASERETVGNAKYILELIQRVTTVSLETMRIVKALPELEI